MRIDHVALWTSDLERSRAFYERWFGGRAGERYENPARGFESYFLEFAGGARLELMRMDGVPPQLGAHFAVAVGSEEAVDALAAELREAGVPVPEGPRRTGDGYYEAVVVDPDGNVVELTASS
jgi:lactoylglutathione lyase